jgi:hypothetical protein
MSPSFSDGTSCGPFGGGNSLHLTSGEARTSDELGTTSSDVPTADKLMDDHQGKQGKLENKDSVVAEVQVLQDGWMIDEEPNALRH